VRFLRHLQRPPGHRGLTPTPGEGTQKTVTVAVDLLGADTAPGVLVGGVVAALRADADLRAVLVGPARLIAGLDSDTGGVDLPVVDAGPAAGAVVGMDEDPVRAVRGRRTSIRTASRLVRDGSADALVSFGHTGATVVAARLELGRLPAISRPPLAVVVPAAAHPVVLLDAGAYPQATPAVLGQHAVVGAVYAALALRVPEPRVGLLSIGSEPGKGDPLRREAYVVLERAKTAVAGHFVGNVEGCDVPLGGTADVVVTDGFTGNVLLKGMEGAARRWGANPGGDGGGVLLGVRGVVVAGHASTTPAAVAAAVGLAARTARTGLIDGLVDRLAEVTR
jgi:phosphate acyltransferase